MNNLPQTIISQYSSSPTLVQLLENFNACVDPSYNYDRFYTDLWNIDTAVGYGLDVLGRRVGIGRVLKIPTATYLGLTGDAGASGESLNVGIFYSGGPLTANYSMTDETYRRVILAKAAANLTDGSIPSINKILLGLFPNRGNCYVQDNLDMTLTYVFTFPITDVEKAIVENSGVLPTPTGVRAGYQYPT